MNPKFYDLPLKKQQAILNAGFPIAWIKDAGHNSNTDKPEEVDRLIRDFVLSLKEA